MAISGVNGSDGVYPQGGSSSNRTVNNQNQEEPSIFSARHKDSQTTSSQSIITANKMTRSTADAWLKKYQEENNCSEKEAKVAFKKQFGHDIPDSTAVKILKDVAGALLGGIPLSKMSPNNNIIDNTNTTIEVIDKGENSG